MIGKILAAVRRLDDWLQGVVGRPYHAALGFGLILEIIGHVRELYEAPSTKTHVVRLVMLIVLYLLLLVHQIGELSEHAERRRGSLPDR